MSLDFVFSSYRIVTHTQRFERKEVLGTFLSGSFVSRILTNVLPELSTTNADRNSWVALVVRPRAEQKAEAGLLNAGIETFVAWRDVRRRWSDRIKVIRENLFPGYVFCRSAYSDRTLVLRQPGVESVVTVNRNPAPIPNHEIDAVRRLLLSGLPLGPWPFLSVGQGVRIAHGLLAGFEGTLIRDCSSWRVVVSINALQRSVAVQVDRDTIVPLSRSPSAA